MAMNAEFRSIRRDDLSLDYSIRYPEVFQDEVLGRSIEQLGIVLPIVCADWNSRLYLLDGRKRVHYSKSSDLPALVFWANSARDLLVQALSIQLVGRPPNLIEQALYLSHPSSGDTIRHMLRHEENDLGGFLKLPEMIQETIARLGLSFREAEGLLRMAADEIESIEISLNRFHLTRSELRKVIELIVDLKRLNRPVLPIVKSAQSNLIGALADARSPEFLKHKRELETIAEKGRGWNFRCPGSPDSDVYELAIRFRTRDELTRRLDEIRARSQSDAD